MQKRIATALTFVLVLLVAGCASPEDRYSASPFDEAKLTLVSGDCDYLNGDKKKTVCKFKIKLNHKYPEAIDFKGVFKFAIATYDYQVRYAQYKDAEDEGFLEVTADEILGLYDGVAGISDVRVDYEMDPLETKSYFVSIVVPTKTIINSMDLVLDKMGETEFYPVGPLYISVCTDGPKSFATENLMQRGDVCESGKIVQMYP